MRLHHSPRVVTGDVPADDLDDEERIVTGRCDPECTAGIRGPRQLTHGGGVGGGGGGAVSVVGVGAVVGAVPGADEDRPDRRASPIASAATTPTAATTSRVTLPRKHQKIRDVTPSPQSSLLLRSLRYAFRPSSRATTAGKSCAGNGGRRALNPMQQRERVAGGAALPWVVRPRESGSPLLRKDLPLKRLFLLLVAALALLVPVVGQAASGPVLNFYDPDNPANPTRSRTRLRRRFSGGAGPVEDVDAQEHWRERDRGTQDHPDASAGTPNSAFTKTGDTCSQPVPISLGKGKTCQTTILFTPVAGGESDAADLTAVSKKPNASKTLHLTGSGRVGSDLSIDLTMALTSDLDLNNSLTLGDRVSFALTLHNRAPTTRRAFTSRTSCLPAMPSTSPAFNQGTYTSATGDWNVGTVSVASTRVLEIVAPCSAATPTAPTPMTRRSPPPAVSTRTARPATTRRARTTTPRSRPRSGT